MLLRSIYLLPDAPREHLPILALCPRYCHIARHPAVSIGDEVEGQLAMRFNVVVALVIIHRYVATDPATVLDDPLGQRLDLVAWNTPSASKEGADLAIDGEGIDAGPTVDACDVLAVLVPATVRDPGGDIVAQSLSHAWAWVVGAEKVAVG